jgi:2-phospho-L-lactate transferase/gluconeogenesis factor (CofD/UPF0052 family)
VRLNPEEPPACDEAVKAIHDADWVILGPGSWFTSVMPHLLVPGVHDALIATAAKRVLTLNLVMHTGETVGFSATNHLEVLAAHAPDLHLDVVLADPDVVEDEVVLRRVAQDMGAELLLARVGDTGRQATTTHCGLRRHTVTSSLTGRNEPVPLTWPTHPRLSGPRVGVSHAGGPSCSRLTGWPYGDDGKGQG